LDRYFYQRIDSTNEEAKRLLKKGKSPPFYVVTEEQTQGKGQQGRKWVSHRGGLYISIVLGEEYNIQRALLIGTLSVQRLLISYISDIKIRFPNDLITKNKKIAGILIEKGNSFTIFGIGINVNQKIFPEQIRERATSLYLITGEKYSIRGIEEDILKHLMDIRKHPISVLFPWYRKALMLDMPAVLHLKKGPSIRTVIKDITEKFDILTEKGYFKLEELVWIEW